LACWKPQERETKWAGPRCIDGPPKTGIDIDAITFGFRADFPISTVLTVSPAWSYRALPGGGVRSSGGELAGALFALLHFLHSSAAPGLWAFWLRSSATAPGRPGMWYCAEAFDPRDVRPRRTHNWGPVGWGPTIGITELPTELRRVNVHKTRRNGLRCGPLTDWSYANRNTRLGADLGHPRRTRVVSARNFGPLPLAMAGEEAKVPKTCRSYRGGVPMFRFPGGIAVLVSSAA